MSEEELIDLWDLPDLVGPDDAVVLAQRSRRLVAVGLYKMVESWVLHSSPEIRPYVHNLLTDPGDYGSWLALADVCCRWGMIKIRTGGTCALIVPNPPTGWVLLLTKQTDAEVLSKVFGSTQDAADPAGLWRLRWYY